MRPWQPAARGRRRAVFALALLAHGGLVGVMSLARVTRERRDDVFTVMSTIWTAPPPRAVTTPALPLPRATRLRALPHPAVEAQAIRAPLLEARAASVPAPPASAASEPLRLTLSPDQLRAVVAGTKPTLAQSLARAPAPSSLARLGGDEAPYEEVPLPGGVTEVHAHGGCFRLVPTSRGQFDPFNHGGERLTAPCTP